jgi:Zn-dependent peptidase ImmA (M78 family)
MLTFYSFTEILNKPNADQIRRFVESKGIAVLFRQLAPGIRGSTFKKNGKQYIIVNKLDSPERQNFTIAHEYCEIQLENKTDLPLDEQHQLANIMAGELLLPDDEFKPAVNRYDLHELKKIFPSVSYEVIARRLVQFKPLVVTIFDNGLVTSRFGSPLIRFPQSATQLEQTTAQSCYETKKTVSVSEPLMTVSGYYIEETNGIVRVYITAEYTGE